ncbi:MAG: YetF domain-containing protein [Tepidiformaceae bacterium]
MFHLGVDWWEIVIRTAVVYLALVVGLRFFGKREIGQMAPFDLVVILLIANAVQNAMVGTDTSLVGGLIAAVTLLVVNFGIAQLRAHNSTFRDFVEGESVVLISDGQLMPKQIRREGIDMLDLEQAIREHGIAGVSDVRLAVLEVDGTISIVPREASGTIRTKHRFRQRSHQN